MKKTVLLCVLILASCCTLASAQDIDELQKQMAALKQELISIRAELAETNRTIAPPGTIAAYMGKTAPKGWLLCDGKTKLDDPKYKDLKDTIGMDTVPDLRGVFLRGLDTEGIKVASEKGRELGKEQPSAFERHNHDGMTGSNGAHTHNNDAAKDGGLLKHARYADRRGTPTGTDGNGWDRGELDITQNFKIASAGAHPHSIPYAGSGTETRPVNVAVNYIIKF